MLAPRPAASRAAPPGAVAATSNRPEAQIDLGTGRDPGRCRRPRPAAGEDRRRARPAASRRLARIMSRGLADAADGPAVPRRRAATAGASSTAWCSASIPTMPAPGGLRACAAASGRSLLRGEGERGRDPAWLAALEEQHGRARRRHRGRPARPGRTLDAASAAGAGPFPRALLAAGRARSRAGSATMPALAAEERLRDGWPHAARRDAEAGSAHRGRTAAISGGPPRGDAACRRPLCSTGEQKALLVAIVLAMPACWRSRAAQRRSCCWTRWRPISTQTRRAALFDELAAPGRCRPGSPAPTPRSSTPMAGDAQFFDVRDGDDRAARYLIRARLSPAPGIKQLHR